MKHKMDWKGEYMSSENEKVEMDQALDDLIQNAVGLIQYAREKKEKPSSS